MANKRIHILVVDDSSLMRVMIGNMLDEQDDMQVVATAQNGKEAVEKVLELKPDVVLLDLVMADFDGTYAIDEIMKSCPTPIIVLSSLGNTEPERMFEAIDRGAYEFVDKPKAALSPKIRNVSAELMLKIRQAARVDAKTLLRLNLKKNQLPHTFESGTHYQILAIGASTGGTKAIEEVLRKLPSNFPLPIVIAQHIPQEFVYSLAARLNQVTPLNTKVAANGERLKPGTVYIAPGNTNLKIVKSGASYKTEFTDDTFREFNHPSVDCLFDSVSRAYGDKALAVILTGMGKDGASGLKKIYDKGGFTIAQDEASCVVYGMPQAAVKSCAVKQIVGLDELSSFIVKCL